MTPKIAIFYDWLNQWGGAERLLLDMLKIYPQAHLYTSVYNPQNTHWLKNIKVKSTWLDNLHLGKKNPLIAILEAVAIESFNFSNYDIVISLTSQAGYALITPPNTCHICYCLTPNRYLYSRSFNLLTPIINKIKQNQLILSSRPDYYLSISQTVQGRLKKDLNKTSTVIYPGVDTTFFKPTYKKLIPNYYLVVCRLVKYKRVDLVIKACLKLNRKLYIVGQGPAENYLKKLSKNNPNIRFFGQVQDTKLLALYQNCLALICPQIDDFGLTPLEAQACGKPVIALNNGGITETVISGKAGIFFNHQTLSSLQKALKKFDTINFSSSYCRHHSLKFSQKHFMVEFRKRIDSLWHQHQKKSQEATL